MLAAGVLAQPNDLNIENLTGKVKSFDEETAVLKEKNGVLVESSRTRTRTVIFDKQGRMTYEWLKIKDIMPREFYYTYEKDNKRVTRMVYLDPFKDPAKKPMEQISLSIFSFDGAKNTLFKDIFVGDDFGHNKSPDELNIPTQKYSYVFDKDNRLLARTMLTLDGRDMITDKYIYGSGNMYTERRMILAGNPRPQIFKYSYETDSQGNWIKQNAENTLADAGATKKNEIIYRKISYYKN